MPNFSNTTKIQDSSGNPITASGGAIETDAVASSNTQAVAGSVAVTNFPATQPVSGTVAVGNFPATQPISGSVAVSNFPATQPVSGSVSISNFPASQPVTGAAEGVTGGAVPADADYVGFNSGGNLVGVSSGNPLPTSLPAATVTALTPPTAAAIGAAVPSASAIGSAVAAPTAAAIASAIVANPPTTPLPTAQVTTLTPPTAAAIGAAVPSASAIGTAVAAPTAAAIASAIVSNPPTVPLASATITALTPPTAVAIGTAVAAPTASAIAAAVVANPPTTPLPTAQVTTLTPPSAAAIAAALANPLPVHDAAPSSQAVTNAGTFAVQASGTVAVSAVSGVTQVSATSAANSATNPIFHANTDGTSAMGVMANFGTTPGAVKALNTNASLAVGTAMVSASAPVPVSATAAANTKTNPLFVAVADSTNQITAAISALGTAPTGTQVMAVNAVNLPTTAAGGALTAKVFSAQATAVNVKASAGNLYGLAIVSATATAGFIMFFNTATTATSGSVWAIPIDASGTVIIPPGLLALLNFAAGIAINVAAPINGTTTQITWTGTIMYA